MAADPGPHDMATTRVVLGPHGDATARPVTPDFYQALNRDFSGFTGHLLIAAHEAAEPWSGWEVHPQGDEFVYLLSGAVDFVLWTDSGEKVLRLDRTGSYILLPRGTWHTARPLEPSSMLFVTPGEGTRHAPSPPGYKVA